MATETQDSFGGMDETAAARVAREAFVVDVDGYEGPIDVLLTLARDQKVDLTQISILQLADQYLEFVAWARKINIELAADYLVMAAWLAYLKSRLLIPDMADEDEPSGEEMAAALAFQLQRLEAMQEVGARLVARPLLGQDFFARGMPEKPEEEVKTIFEVTLYDLLKAYADQKRKDTKTTLQIEAWGLYSVENALARLRQHVGRTPEWENLVKFLPPGLKDIMLARSALASTFTASLELAKEGRLRIRQMGTFGPIYLRGTDEKRGPDGGGRDRGDNDG
ncbi:MAG: segregation/condensation protein A [Rhodospirillales bacterium]|nr:segregation/condensation protein A [Rhodospirillales bacterium]